MAAGIDKSALERAAQLKARGTEAFKNQDFDNAIRLYGEAIEANPTDHLLLSNRSASYASVCRYEEALIDAERCIKLKPDFSKGYSRAGFAQYHMNKLLEAKKSYEEGLKHDASSSMLTTGLKDVEDALSARRGGKRVSRSQLISLLGDAAKVQAIVQHKVNAASEAAVAAGKTTLSLQEAHLEVKKLQLPKDPFEQHGLTENDFQQIIAGYETDQAVMNAAQPIFAPRPQGDCTKAEKIAVSTLLEVHQFMVARMKAVIEEFSKLDSKTQNAIPGKEREHAAELLVSVEVQASFKIGAKELETATILHEMELQQDEAFLECTEQLAALLQSLRAPPTAAANTDSSSRLAGVPEEPQGAAAPAGTDENSVQPQQVQPVRNSSALACQVGTAVALTLGAVAVVLAKRSKLP